MPPGHRLAKHSDDVATYEGPHGYAAVRRPAESPTAPKRIGDSHGSTFGFWRVAFVVKGLGTDVYQVRDEDEGRKVAEALVNHGDLQGMKPNEGRFRVGASPKLVAASDAAGKP